MKNLGLVTHLQWSLSMDEKQAEAAANVAEEWGATSFGGYAFGRCESVAERLFLLGAHLLGQKGVLVFLRNSKDEFFGKTEDALSVLVKGSTDNTWVYSQATAGDGKYRTDFVFERVVFGSPVRMAVEIDGHDFHDRTKEQASSDRERDRWFLGIGVTTVRFTGADLYTSPLGVFLDALSSMDNICRAYKKAYFAGYESGTDTSNDCHSRDFRDGYKAGRGVQRILTREQ